MLITIQHCINCSQHQWSTRHNQSRYLDLFHQFSLRFQSLGYTIQSIKKPKLGSFEISLNNYLLFSKLESGQFPDVDSVVKLVQEFGRLDEKGQRERYEEMREKRERKTERKEEERERVGRPGTAGREVKLGFSPRKHRSKIRLYTESNNMSRVLSKSRKQASLSASRTLSTFNPSSTVQSRFFNQKELKFRQTNPEWNEEGKEERKNMRDPFDHDIIIKNMLEEEETKKEGDGGKGGFRRMVDAVVGHVVHERESSQEPRENVGEREREMKQMMETK